MSPLDRIPLSLRMMVRGLVFLVRMWASERRFQRHARRRRQHAADATRHLAGMEAEVRLRTWLCQRREAGVKQPCSERQALSSPPPAERLGSRDPVPPPAVRLRRRPQCEPLR